MDQTYLLMLNVRTWKHKVGENGVTECGEGESERIRKSVIEGENEH